MKVILYRANEDLEFENTVKTAYPDQKFFIINPEHFDAADMDKADKVFVRPRYTGLIEAYTALGVPVDTMEGGQEEEIEEESPYSAEYEAEVDRLTSMSVSKLTMALSRVSDLGLLYLARDRESQQQKRVGANVAYNQAIKDAGGII
jgi:hypothetical protein